MFGRAGIVRLVCRHVWPCHRLNYPNTWVTSRSRVPVLGDVLLALRNGYHHNPLFPRGGNVGPLQHSCAVQNYQEALWLRIFGPFCYDLAMLRVRTNCSFTPYSKAVGPVWLLLFKAYTPSLFYWESHQSYRVSQWPTIFIFTIRGHQEQDD